MSYVACVNHNEPPIPDKGPSIFAFSDQEAREAGLRAAIENDEIDVLFQPQVDAATGELIGAEALARWKHPEFGELGASKLFTMARNADLISALSRQVARKALRLAAKWPSHLRLSINVTPSELNDKQFESHIGRLLNESDFPLDRLVLEITEDEPLEDLPATAEILERLRSGGIAIALDDFGAGYSNFNYLKQLPLDTIKLDRSIMAGVGDSKRDLAILRSIMSLTQALDLKVVAEGIETDVQRQIAVQEGCTSLQGFFIAEPGTEEALLEMAVA